MIKLLRAGQGGAVNTSLLFDLVNDYVQFTDTTFLEGATTFSFSFWYKNTAATWPSIMRIFSKDNAASHTHGIIIAFYNINKFIVAVSNGSLKYKEYAGITNQDTWQPYGGVVDLLAGSETDKIRLYYLGARVSPTGSITPSPATVGVNGIAGRIGCNSYAVSDMLGGNLKNFVWWSDAVDQNVIDMAVDINAIPNPTNLIRNWTCNGQNPSTVMTDSTGNENGELKNFLFVPTISGWEAYP